MGNVGSNELRIDPEASFLIVTLAFTFRPRGFADTVTAARSATLAARSGPKPLWREIPFHHAEFLAQAWTTRGDHRTLVTFRSESALERALGGGGRVSWRITRESRPCIDVAFGSRTGRSWACHLALFRTGIGLLSMRLVARGDDCADWLDLLHLGRYHRGRRGNGLEALRSAGPSGMQPFFPKFVHASPDGRLQLGHVLAGVLDATLGTNGHAWAPLRQRETLYGFASVYLDGSTDSPLARDVVDRAVRFQGRPSQNNPTAPASVPPEDPDRFWRNLHSSLDGTVFLSRNAPRTPYARRQLPAQLRDEFFVLHLFALHQRVALVDVAAAIPEVWLARDDTSDRTSVTFEDLQERLLLSVASGRIAHDITAGWHKAYYDKVLRAYGVQSLFRDVDKSISDMTSYVILRRTEQLRALADAEEHRRVTFERWVGAIAALVGVPALMIGFLGINITDWTNDGMPLAAAVGFALFGFVLGGALLVLVSHVSRRRAAGRRPAATVLLEEALPR